MANYYLQLRGTERVLQITQHNLAFADQLVTLTLERQAAGLTTALDVANARATQAQIQSQIPGLIAQRDGLIDQIGLLLGETPEELPPALVTAGPDPGDAADRAREPALHAVAAPAGRARGGG